MKKIFKNIWHYYENKSSSFFRINEMDALIKNLDRKKYKNIIDIGSGDGFLTRILFEKSFILGIDNDEAGDAIIAKKKKRINNFLFQDARKKWNIKNKKKYDLVFSNSVLEHIPNVENVVSNASKINKKHEFIFTVPNHNFEKSLFPQIFYKIPLFSFIFSILSQMRNKQLNHYNTKEKSFWLNIFKKNGYMLIKCKEYLSSDQITMWNLNAIFYKFFKINIIKSENLFKKKKINKNCCYLFIFRKI